MREGGEIGEGQEEGEGGEEAGIEGVCGEVVGAEGGDEVGLFCGLGVSWVGARRGFGDVGKERKRWRGVEREMEGEEGRTFFV